MSTRVGSRILNTDFIYFNEGAYGTVFVDNAARRVTKLYRRDGNPEDHSRQVFASEWEALAKASENDALHLLVMAPVARVSNYEVVDAEGKNITADFLDDAGLEGALIEGAFRKIGSVDAPNKDEIRAAFQAAGIWHINDASVIQDVEGNITKVIDFGMRDIELEW